MTQTRGRAATNNRASQRFDLPDREVDGDWLDVEGVGEELPPLPTTITVERPRTIITRNQSPDLPFDRSINAYRGCEHGCIYCYARPTHAYHGLSQHVILKFDPNLDSPNYGMRAKFQSFSFKPDMKDGIQLEINILRGDISISEPTQPGGEKELIVKGR